jgi:hypothetical protein
MFKSAEDVVESLHRLSLETISSVDGEYLNRKGTG